MGLEPRARKEGCKILTYLYAYSHPQHLAITPGGLTGLGQSANSHCLMTQDRCSTQVSWTTGLTENPPHLTHLGE